MGGAPRRDRRCSPSSTIVVAALLPASLVASKDVERDGETVSEDTPYAVVPASVQAVADRVSYAELGADVAVDTDPDGRVFFVTVSEPAQSVLGWLGGRGTSRRSAS